MDLQTIKQMLNLIQPQLSADDYAAVVKTVNREYLYSQIDECEAFLNRKVYPVSEKPLMEQAATRKCKLEQQLASL